ncbi:hypothetical protein PPL_04042 [Heterostelium album PN500]|uniref:E2F/DP family winged-helix DNA-binding domain-containing protein n=1 Tax=Heterostelium pallidum (strain ATCC 26659 / Pp 5 / PN500) TaxID=670386 RepID=D3B5V4_HETP5|nr:hypothetical protein PPL_04042 [Heterostelium album PN500]EFA83252.1 hypothetical protein PPL_04042 [Heterostelium album PN500]|eukprot:XP_020435369.1 hypothetical protein PPL_04042 [Heterostelium album PN500]
MNNQNNNSHNNNSQSQYHNLFGNSNLTLTDNTQQNQYYLNQYQQDGNQHNFFYQNQNQNQYQNNNESYYSNDNNNIYYSEHSTTTTTTNNSDFENINNNNVNNSQYVFSEIVNYDQYNWEYNSNQSNNHQHYQHHQHSNYQSPCSSPPTSLVEFTSEENLSEGHSDSEWSSPLAINFHFSPDSDESIDPTSSPLPAYSLMSPVNPSSSDSSHVSRNQKSPKQQLKKNKAKPLVSPPSSSNPGTPVVRTNKSLKSICDSFLEEYEGNTRKRIKIEMLSQKIAVDNRRFYEIIKVMQCLGLVEKEGKNEYYWVGRDNVTNNINNIFHSSRNYITDETEFVCENCKHHHEQNNTNSPVTANEDAEDTGISKQCKQLIKLFFLHNTISCQDASIILNCQKKAQGKRIYDIVNILYSLQVINRLDRDGSKKQFYTWKGPPTKQELINKLKNFRTHEKTKMNQVHTEK